MHVAVYATVSVCWRHSRIRSKWRQPNAAVLGH